MLLRIWFQWLFHLLFPIKVGTRRRVRLQDVMAYKRDLYEKRRQTLNELTAYDQELGLQ